ncbi:MAG: hypothetical protein ABL921_12480 [Pirellula sp.]
MRVLSWAKARLGLLRHPVFIGLCLLALIGIGIGAWLHNDGIRPSTTDPDSLANQDSNTSESTTSQGSLSFPKGWTVYGGIARPSTDVRVSYQDDKKKPRKKIYKLEGPRPKLNVNANAETAQIAEALSGKRDPSTLSSSIVPTSFNKAQFDANKEAYATEYAKNIEPGRVFVTAQLGDGVPVLRSDGGRFHRVNQGERVRLKVDAPAGAPIAFSSMKSGQFINQLSSITVVADQNGKAEALFTASSGTIGEIPILAASPVASGQIRFVVSVAPKRDRPTAPPGD